MNKREEYIALDDVLCLKPGSIFLRNKWEGMSKVDPRSGDEYWYSEDSGRPEYLWKNGCSKYDNTTLFPEVESIRGNIRHMILYCDALKHRGQILEKLYEIRRTSGLYGKLPEKYNYYPNRYIILDDPLRMTPTRFSDLNLGDIIEECNNKYLWILPKQPREHYANYKYRDYQAIKMVIDNRDFYGAVPIGWYVYLLKQILEEEVMGEEYVVVQDFPEIKAGQIYYKAKDIRGRDVYLPKGKPMPSFMAEQVEGDYGNWFQPVNKSKFNSVDEKCESKFRECVKKIKNAIKEFEV